MRKDMKHVIIDRPRIGSGDGGKSPTPKGSIRREQRIPIDELPKRESMSRHRRYGFWCKYLNEHLGPLRRYLRTNCGRPWDEVFSEICEHLRIDSATQYHVHQHIDDYVLTTTCWIDGKVCNSDGQPLGESWGWRSWALFHVDPRDGTLQESPQRKRSDYRQNNKRREGESVRIRGVEYRHRNGHWYEVTFGQVPYPEWNAPPSQRNPTVFDVFVGEYIDAEDAKELYGSREYIASKRRLKKKEIHDLKLWNTTYGKKVLEAEQPARVHRKKSKNKRR